MRSFPFTAEVYFSLFETYNRAIWPAQLVAYALGIAIVFLALRPTPAGSRIALAVLSAFWLWNGIAYHFMHFLQINFAALGFGALFVLQGLLFAAMAVRGGPLRRLRADQFGGAGLLFCVIALAVYPLLAWLVDHGWPRAAIFGVTPAPMVIFTIGALLMLEGAPRYLAAIPLLWALVAGCAAVLLLQTPEDLTLLIAGVAGSGLLIWSSARRGGGTPRVLL